MSMMDDSRRKAGPDSSPAEPKPHHGEKPAPEPVLTRLRDVKAEPVPWLWKGWLPEGTLSILDGDPGLGKSTLTLDLAARVSRGWEMPPGSGLDMERDPAGVLLLGAEDSLKHTVRPRLDAAGADSDFVTSLEGFRIGEEIHDPVLPWDLDRLADWITQNAVRLVIVDPLMAFLGSEYDAHKDSDIRRCMRPLRDFAERHGVTVLLLRHLNKLNGGAALYRGGGSIGITGAARASLIVGRDPNEPRRHVLAMNKINLAATPRSLAFFIEPQDDVSRVAWEGLCDLTKEDILWHAQGGPKPKTEASKLEEAKDFLTQLLCNAPVAVLEIQENAKALQISWKTVQRARAELSIKAFKDGSRWFWEFSED